MAQVRGAVLDPVPHAASAARDPARAVSRDALIAFGDVAEALAEGVDLDELLHRIARRMCDLEHTSRCSIYLRHGDDGLFRGAAGHPGEIDDAWIKRSIAGVPADRLTQEIVATQRPVVVDNVAEDPRPVRSTMRKWGVHSLLGVPMILRGEVIGLMFLDDGERPRAFGQADVERASTFADLAAVAIAQARMTDELRANVAIAARQNALLRTAAAMDDRLSALGVAGGDLQRLAAAVAELTGKPTSIHDPSHRRLAVATPPGMPTDRMPRLLDGGAEQHPAVLAALAEVLPTGGGVVGPFPDLGLARRHLVAPAVVRGQGVHHVIVLEAGSRFGPLDLHVARRAATNVALEVTAQRRAKAAASEARASLAADLLRGDQDGVALDRRAEHLGVNLQVPRVVCLIDTAPSGGPEPTPARVAAALAPDGACGRVLAAGVAEGTAALLELPGDVPVVEAVGAVARDVRRGLAALGAEHAAVALSARWVRPADCVAAYAEARKLLAALRAHSEDGVRVLSADDLGAGRLLLGAADRDEPLRFAREALGALVAEDDATAELLPTLRAFFDLGRSVRAAALALGVHENTIRYRLARVEQTTGLAVLGDSGDQLAAQLALLVLRLEGPLPAT